MPEHAEDVAREAFSTVGNVLFWALFTVWTLAWLAVAGLGAFTDVDFALHLGLGVAGGTALVVGSGRLGRHLVLKSRAKTSLVARARFEGVKLNRDAQAVLGAFDHSYQRALALLSAPDLSTVAIDARHDLERVRERIYDVVSTEMRLRLDAKKLRRLRTVGAVRSAVGEAEDKMRALHEESNHIAEDAARLADRLDRVRQLAAGSAARADEAHEGLTRVLEDLDQTASAYEEIERERLESAEERADRLLKARRTPQKT